MVRRKIEEHTWSFVLSQIIQCFDRYKNDIYSVEENFSILRFDRLFKKFAFSSLSTGLQISKLRLFFPSFLILEISFQELLSFFLFKKTLSFSNSACQSQS